MNRVREAEGRGEWCFISPLIRQNHPKDAITDDARTLLFRFRWLSCRCGCLCG